MSHKCHYIVGWLAAIVAFGAPALAQQPQFQTPGGQVPVFVPVYTIPYSASIFGSVDTVVTVGLNEAAAACQVQLEWLDGQNVLQGVSGPFPVGPGETYEFTTSILAAPQPNPAFIQNVFRNRDTNFEGHAKVRSNCTAGTKLRVNAQTVVTDLQTSAVNYLHIKVTKVPGNTGD